MPEVAQVFQKAPADGLLLFQRAQPLKLQYVADILQHIGKGDRHQACGAQGQDDVLVLVVNEKLNEGLFPKEGEGHGEHAQRGDDQRAQAQDGADVQPLLMVGSGRVVPLAIPEAVQDHDQQKDRHNGDGVHRREIEHVLHLEKVVQIQHHQLALVEAQRVHQAEDEHAQRFHQGKHHHDLDQHHKDCPAALAVDEADQHQEPEQRGDDVQPAHPQRHKAVGEDIQAHQKDAEQKIPGAVGRVRQSAGDGIEKHHFRQGKEQIKEYFAQENPNAVNHGTQPFQAANIAFILPVSPCFCNLRLRERGRRGMLCTKQPEQEEKAQWQRKHGGWKKKRWWRDSGRRTAFAKRDRWYSPVPP